MVGLGSGFQKEYCLCVEERCKNKLRALTFLYELRIH